MRRSMLAPTAVVTLLGALVGCASPPPESSPQPEAADPSYLSVVPLTSAEFSITEMATAHGAFTVEVEVDLGADTASIARRLVEPVQDRYAEILVYFYDRAGDGELPISRVQWTAEDGYSTVEY